MDKLTGERFIEDPLITKEEFDVIKKCQKEFNKTTLKIRKEKYLKTKTGNVNFVD